MKTFTTLFACLLLACTTFTNSTVTASTTSAPATFVDNAPEKLPITSKAELKLYALNQVTSGFVWIYGEKIMSSVGEVRSFYVEGSGAADVLTQLLSPANQFNFKVSDASADLYVYGSLRNKDGDTVFNTEFQQVKTTQSGAGLQLSYMNLVFKMNPEVPLSFPGAYAARVEYTDEDNNRWQEELRVYDGKIWFPVDYAYTNAVLIVDRSWPNGNPPQGYDLELTYSAANGTRILNTVATGQIAGASIQNHSEVTDLSVPRGGVCYTLMSAAPPSNNQWQYFEPITGKVTLQSTQEGDSRPFQARIAVAGATPSQIGTTEAYAYDPNNKGPDGKPIKYTGTVTVIPSNGTNPLMIDISWGGLPNNGQTLGGPVYDWYLKASGYENQVPPQQQYYYNTTTTSTTKG